MAVHSDRRRHDEFDLGGADFPLDGFLRESRGKFEARAGVYAGVAIADVEPDGSIAQGVGNIFCIEHLRLSF